MNQPASPIPSELLTLKSLKTLSGASITVWIVCLVLSSLLPEHTLKYWHYRIVAFVLSILITITIVHYKKNSQKLAYWLLILGNTCYIFINASGINSISKNQLFSKSPDPVTDTTHKQDGFYDQKRNTPVMAGFFSFLRETDWWPDKEIIGENSALKEKLALSKSNNTGIFPEKDSLLKKISILEEQIAGFTDGRSVNEKSLTDQNTDLAAQVKTLTAALDREKNKNGQLLKDNKKPDNANLINQIDNLKAEVERLTNLLSSCNQKYRDCLNKNDQLIKDCAGKPDNISLTKQINSLKGEIAKLTNLLNDEKNKTDELTKSLTACEQRYRDCLNSKDDKGILEKYKSCEANYQRAEQALQHARDSVNRCCTQKMQPIPFKKIN